jgi:alkylation response protein AidB-like acyl-CoA dehydrogenase
MTFNPPVLEQRFLLDHIVGIAQLEEGANDLVDPILEESAKLAAGEFAPLNRIGDEHGARWKDGAVTMPPGFREAYSSYVEGGWGTLTASPDYGGQGLPYALGTCVFESLTAANTAFSLCVMLTAGAIDALQHHGSDSQKERFLPKLITGEWSGTMCLTEPQAGSDVGALRSEAERRDDGSFAIRGQKIFITYGEHDLTGNIVHLVLARIKGAPAGTKGISLFLVPKFRRGANGEFDQPNGVHCLSIEKKLGIHASPTCVLAFGDGDECIGELIGEENGGMRAMFTMMNNARLNVGLQGVAIAERATQDALAYATTRIQGRRAGSEDPSPVPISQHADVRRMLLRMKALTQASRALVYYTAGMIDKGVRGDRAAATRVDLLTPLAKAYGTDVGCEVASIGIQVHGGMGFIEETGAAQHLRDARITPIYEGTNGIQAADLVTRKLALGNGAVLNDLVAEIKAASADQPQLQRLADEVARLSEYLAGAGVEDRLAGSYPYLTMLSVCVCGWLMALQLGRASEDSDFGASKRQTARFYLDRIVPEVMGLSASVTAGAGSLYALSEAALLS